MFADTSILMGTDAVIHTLYNLKNSRDGYLKPSFRRVMIHHSPGLFLPYWNMRRILEAKAIDAIYLCIILGFCETQDKINIFHIDQLNFAEYRLYTRSRMADVGQNSLDGSQIFIFRIHASEKSVRSESIELVCHGASHHRCRAAHLFW